jgi:hypothetical protein
MALIFFSKIIGLKRRKHFKRYSQKMTIISTRPLKCTKID